MNTKFDQQPLYALQFHHRTFGLEIYYFFFSLSKIYIEKARFL